jgi:hypothetical protein
MPGRRAPLATRFWAKVAKTGPEDCWNWIGAKDNHGYGIIADTKRRPAPLKAPRVSWELHFGAPATGLVVRHKCDNPGCVNPNHLEIGTQRDNARDTAKRGRLNPVSQLNLRPGSPGYHGAGPVSRKEGADGISE